jgi:hypothetical protein
LGKDVGVCITNIIMIRTFFMELSIQKFVVD